MTIIDEVADSEKINQISYVEFIEFIARVAQIIFKKNKTMKLYDKIYSILKKMFKLIPAVPIHPETEFYLDSESDDEEY